MKTKCPTKTDAFSQIDVVVCMGALTILTLVALPMFAPHRYTCCKISCVNNQKQIALAFRIWSGDNNDKFPMAVSATNGGALEAAALGSAYDVFLVMSNELNTPKLLFCPEESNPHRTCATSFARTPGTESSPGFIPFTATNNLSFFVGLDANETNSHTILSGDDHFSVRGILPRPGLLALGDSKVGWRKGRHEGNGYVAMADGSVQSLSSAGLKATLEKTGIATNRFAMP